MNTFFSRNRLVLAGVAALCVLLIAGCSVLKRHDEAGTDGGVVSRSGPQPVYLDFDDILIPENLQPDREKTSVFRIGDMTAGVLAINGRVPSEKLIDFFDHNMSRDNWKIVSSFRAPRSMLLFEKGTRWCVITIFEDDFDHKTRVEIWVSPKNEDVDSGVLQ